MFGGVCRYGDKDRHGGRYCVDGSGDRSELTGNERARYRRHAPFSSVVLNFLVPVLPATHFIHFLSRFDRYSRLADRIVLFLMHSAQRQRRERSSLFYSAKFLLQLFQSQLFRNLIGGFIHFTP